MPVLTAFSHFQALDCMTKPFIRLHEQLRSTLLNLSRTQKRLLQLLTDLLLIWLALWLALWLRLDSITLFTQQSGYWQLFVLAPLSATPIFIRFGLYRTVMRYVSGQAMEAILKAVTLSSLVFAALFFMVQPSKAALPRTTLVIYWLCLLILIGGSRWLMRRWFQPSVYNTRKQVAQQLGQPITKARVLIYGAGAAGNQLLTALRMSPELLPLGFVDDDPNLVGRIVAGLRVYAPNDLATIISSLQIDEVLLALPSATKSRRAQLVNYITEHKAKVRTVPGFMDLASGRVKVADLRQVDIADLLGRESVAPQAHLLEHCIRAKVVLVTGAGGSIGSELCRQILLNQPAHLVLVEHSEFALYQIHQELSQKFSDARITPILGSIRNQSRMTDIMRAWKVTTVYHAAAYKHVPLVEHNIAEGIHNNVLGTLYTAQAAIVAEVQNFVLVSTDKAVRPTNIMGATKRVAELILQALSQERSLTLYGKDPDTVVNNQTRFTMVRFGNVLGSSGSVIPVFKEQIQRGGPITVTHPDITRYFMTIPEAAQLVIQAGAMGGGGDVFVLDMGEPVRIADLAKKMVQLSGLQVKSDTNPHGDISICYTQLRPGEKLYEELLIDNNTLPTNHDMIMRAQEAYMPWTDLKSILAEISAAAKRDDYLHIREALKILVSGYQAEPTVVDWLHQQLKQTTIAPVTPIAAQADSHQLHA